MLEDIISRFGQYICMINESMHKRNVSECYITKKLVCDKKFTSVAEVVESQNNVNKLIPETQDKLVFSMDGLFMLFNHYLGINLIEGDTFVNTIIYPHDYKPNIRFIYDKFHDDLPYYKLIGITLYISESTSPILTYLFDSSPEEQSYNGVLH